MEKLNGLLLRFPPGGGARFAAAAGPLSFDGAGGVLELEPLFSTGGLTDVGVAESAAGREWYLARLKRPPDAANEWDVAYEAYRSLTSGVGLSANEGAAPELVEPDLLQQWPYETPRPEGLAAAEADACIFEDQNPNWPRRPGDFAWHLGDEFS